MVWEGDDVLTVPTAGLFRRGERWVVYVVEDGRAVLREVEIGMQNGRTAEVLSGLDAGEIVVLHPGDQVTAGVGVVGRESASLDE